MSFKQRIHNLFYGENHRHRNIAEHYDAINNLDELTRMLGLTEPDPVRNWGIDISGRWDGIVDLATTSRMGGSFVFIKGLDGTIRTPYYKENRTNAIQAGLLHGPYQWLYKDKNVSCTAQARAMYDLLNQYPTDLPPVVDFEWTYWMGAPSNPTYADLEKYLAELDRLGVEEPIVYTAAGFTNPLGPVPAIIKALTRAWWIANYGVISPTLPNGIIGWDFWQASASGNAVLLAPNTTGKLEVDIDYWRGDRASLYDFAGLTPGSGETPMPYMKVIDKLNIRSTPGVTSTNDIGDFLINDIVEPTGDPVTAGSYTWRRIVRGWRNNSPLVLPGPECWVASGWLVPVEFTPPTPPPPSGEYILHVKDGVTRKFVLSDE